MKSKTVEHIALAILLGFWFASAASPALAGCEAPGGDIHRPGDEGAGSGGTGLKGDEGSGAGGTGLKGDEGSGAGGTGRQVAETGTGGTGLTGDEGSGAGGTGVRVVEGGIGGTGIWEDIGSGTGGTGLQGGDEGSGTGGTGILGTVTGFGSVCVNGLRVGYDESTPVVRDGRNVSSGELAVGQVVRITTRPGTPLHAQRIAVENAMSGPVTRVELSQNRIWVMDQLVELPPNAPVFDRVTGRSTDRAGIVAGSRVEISGQRRSDGVVVATRVESRAADGPDSATGVAIAAAGRTAYVGDLRTTLALESEVLTSGDRVVLRGRWNAETRTLERASLGNASAAAGGVERLSLEGFVEPSGRGGDFEISGTAVDASAIDRTLPRDLLVRVHGRLDKQGRLHAERIQVRRSPREDAVSDAVDRSHGSNSDRADRSGRREREERGDRSGSGRGDRTDRPERNDRSGRSERSGRD
ncbi:MAG: hypothetical protein JRG94_11705 [Deltaproteobacteria bacterium]|nr:hypothetical protein [Deltaproteobacteria bacterium]